MIVCLCNALSERDIVRMAQETGARCPNEIYAHLGCKPRCGTCLDFAADLLEKEGAPTASAPAALMVATHASEAA